MKVLELAQSVDYHVLEGDCLGIMPTLAAESVDAIVTDPPYGLTEPRSGGNGTGQAWGERSEDMKARRRGGFMGKEWDSGVPGEAFWREALRVAKPGAHLLAFGGSRTVHRLAVAIEDAGWEIRDTIMWLYGSGFPKSKDASKAIDAEAGAERETVGEYIARGYSEVSPTDDGRNQWAAGEVIDKLRAITIPATPEAQQYQGWGTALKPAHEPIIVARKPLQGTVASNVVKWGTGAINVDGCRVAADPAIDDMLRTTTRGKRQSETWENGSGFKNETNSLTGVPANGRWPANVVHDGSEEVLRLFPVTTSGIRKAAHADNGKRTGTYGAFAGGERSQDYGGDTGSAARFFYCAKASKADRDEGLDGYDPRQRDDSRKQGDPGGDNPRNRGAAPRANHHPTVKPTSLMRWLVRLVTPPGGVILDPFCGSGSTGKAAMLEGFRFIGIEQDADYCAIARARIGYAVADRTFGLFDMPEEHAQAAD